MKFKASDFSGYPKDCDTVKAMLKWAKGKQFTMEEFDAAFPCSRVFTASIQYMKPTLLKSYIEKYMKERGGDMITALADRHRQLEDVHVEKNRILLAAQQEIKSKKAQLDRATEDYRVQMYNLGDKEIGDDRSIPSVRRILSNFYSYARRDVSALNSLLHSTLCNCIMAQLEFDLDDFAWIDKNCKGGYWYGVSTNGKSYGESFYNLACVYNSSATLSYEKFMNRVPFLLKNHKLHTGVKFKMDGLIWTITGWTNDKDTDNAKFSDQNIITCVGYKDMEGKGERKLKKFNREQWLEDRKRAELITDYSFHGSGRGHY